jgi:hypothetical protein
VTDDPPDPWDPDPTNVDSSLTETNPFKSLDWMAGREEGFSSGVERTVNVIEWELALVGFDERSRLPIVRRIREAALRRG